MQPCFPVGHLPSMANKRRHITLTAGLPRSFNAHTIEDNKIGYASARCKHFHLAEEACQLRILFPTPSGIIPLYVANTYACSHLRLQENNHLILGELPYLEKKKLIEFSTVGAIIPRGQYPANQNTQIKHTEHVS